MVAGGILIHMNKNGNPGSLVASHPGNTNAVRYGVHSERTLQRRAAEIAAEFTKSFDFSIAQRVAVEQVARCMAILEALDRDLDERGLTGKRGEPRYLLNHRSRVSGQLDRWLSKIAPAMERQTSENQASSPPGRADYIAELQRIALGQDTTASARDRVSAIKELFQIEKSAAREVTTVSLTVTGDDEFWERHHAKRLREEKGQRELARLADELEPPALAR